MALPHFTNIMSHNKLWEPVYLNLFEVVIIIPPAIQALHPGYDILLLENATSVSFPTYPTIGTETQRFKFSTRVFATLPPSTHSEFDITFNLNVKDDYQTTTFKILKSWYDLVWNNEDGSTHYKKNMLGDIIVHNHDKEGQVIRRVTYHNCQILNISGWEKLDWGSTSIASLTAKFVADYWEDSYY